LKQNIFEIKSKDSACEVFSGFNLENEIIKRLKKFKSKKFVIITDSKVYKLHSKKFHEKLLINNIESEITFFPEGEKHKNRKTKAQIEDFMLEKKLGRDTIIIAFGGGVVGDLAGFVAATYMRGIKVIQIPTTTIAISDSSYGGKTAIDVPAGKNLIGAFHQPIAVFMDAKYLETLDKKNYVSGLTEIIKHGLIKDNKFYEFVKKNIGIILDRKNKNYGKIMEELMIKNIKIKRDVVKNDEKENNLRKILNYGHTMGHAVEKLSNFKLTHGEAISIGIVAESFLAMRKNICSEKTFLEQKNIFEKLNLPTRIPSVQKTKNIIDLMCVDKKARKSKPEFALISEIGKYAIKKNGEVSFSFEIEDLEKIIKEFRNLK
jgi:3-dehydroquinate synthase